MVEEAPDDTRSSREEEHQNEEEVPSSPMHGRVWNAGNDDAAGKLAEELAERLQLASTVLLDRLFEYLSRLPSEEESADKPLGLTLPASAIGWLSTQLYPQVYSSVEEERRDDRVLWMGSSMHDRLASLRFLLPRVKHVRVTSEEWPPSHHEKSTSTSQTQNFEGTDVDPDALSVESTLTLESTAPPRPSLRAFLFQYYILQNHPRVDLRLFPSLQVLLLERIPPEWVCNIHVVRDSLELLRTERACIYNLTDFLFPHNGDEEVTEDISTLVGLTHLKLKNCSIGELSGLSGLVVEREDRSDDHDLDENDVLASPRVPVPPPFSRLPNLVSLSLAHNELLSVRTALAGLSALPLLRRLDLSYNYLTSMRGVNAMLGNVKVVILSGNRIRNVEGLDRLYSLEKLALDGNHLKDLASVAGLAKLPELNSLKLYGNPVAELKPKKYRVDVLNLFREQRFSDFPPNATYRQLLEILPVLDGKPASKAELVGLRGFAFSQWVAARDSSVHETSTPVASAEGEPPSSLSVGISKRPNRVSRRGKPRKIVIEESPLDHVELHSPVSETTSGRAFLKDDGDITKNVRFSLYDLVATLPTFTPILYEEEAESEEALSINGELKAEPIAEGHITDVQPSSTSCALTMNGAGSDTSPCTSLRPGNTEKVQAGLSFISLSPVLKDGSVQAKNATDTEGQTSTEPPSFRTAEDRSLTSESRPSVVVNAVSESEALDETDGMNNDFSRKESAHNQIHNVAMLADEPDATSTDAEFPDEFESILSPAPETIVFPDYVWEEDENSVLSSIKTGSVNAAYSESKYQEAEDESTYDGLDHLKGLPVLTNLELYFRCFVFRVSLGDKQQSFQDMPSDDDKVKLMLDLAPRIQLRPVDWRLREAKVRDSSTVEIYAMTERFDRVWREEALACGKLAAKRLTPHRKPKRGFHGDVSFSDGKLQKSCECRSIIVCSSDSAIYFVSDYDAVTRHQLSKAAKRRFPMPIPENSLFQNAVWPHALARHPISTLGRITIGFGFQRLSLHFTPARESGRKSSDEFTYIFITCNKLRTVNLLQHFQSIAKEYTSRSSDEDAAGALKIDNDDKQVLDALSEAVAPEAVGMVLHYQIVQQRWQHGDRGTVRRVCIVTDSHLYLLDEDYVGDGSESFEAGARRKLGEVCLKMVDSAAIEQVSEVQASLEDPRSITVIVKPVSRLQRYHRWRLVCHDREGAERLVEEIRKVMPNDSDEP